MGLFAFRRMKEREAAAQAAVSVPEKPTKKTSTVTPDVFIRITAGTSDDLTVLDNALNKIIKKI